jgi:methionine-gamma-lyase
MNRNLTQQTELVNDSGHKRPFGTLTTPICPTVTYVFDSTEQGRKRHTGEDGGFIYTRLGNPTTNELEEKIARLEGGEAAVAFSSGMGAICSTILTFIKAGDHMLADKAMYGGTFDLLHHKLGEFGVEVEVLDFRDLKALEAAIRPETAMVYCETITNPTMKVVDIEAIATMTHRKAPKALVVIDNTFATPMLFQPLKAGADIVVESGTKYINGHSDVLAGFAITDKEKAWLIKDHGLKFITGAVMSPQDAYLVIRGLNAMAVARYMEESPFFAKVYYPGLPSHPDHEIAKKELSGFGGMIAFEMSSYDIARNLLDNLQVINLAVSLGDVESLIEHPASMTHSTLTNDEMVAAGFNERLIRFSVGIESAEDLIADLEQGAKLAHEMTKQTI